jgi:hypothetical protein
VSTFTAAPTPPLGPAPGALGTSQAASRLSRYTEHDTGAIREIVRLPLADGGALVIDRLSGEHVDARLVARLAPDEPCENAQILCALYLADESRGRCRLVTAADLDAAPIPELPDVCREHELRDANGTGYRIQRVASDGRLPELRGRAVSRPAVSRPSTCATSSRGSKTTSRPAASPPTPLPSTALTGRSPPHASPRS